MISLLWYVTGQFKVDESFDFNFRVRCNLIGYVLIKTISELRLKVFDILVRKNLKFAIT